MCRAARCRRAVPSVETYGWAQRSPFSQLEGVGPAGNSLNSGPDESLAGARSALPTAAVQSDKATPDLSMRNKSLYLTFLQPSQRRPRGATSACKAVAMAMHKYNQALLSGREVRAVCSSAFVPTSDVNAVAAASSGAVKAVLVCARHPCPFQHRLTRREENALINPSTARRTMPADSEEQPSSVISSRRAHFLVCFPFI